MTLQYVPFDQEKAPMKIHDVPHYLDYLARLHAACWDIPVNEEQQVNTVSCIPLVHSLDCNCGAGGAF